jgi:signal transduction histidine kinase
MPNPVLLHSIYRYFLYLYITEGNYKKTYQTVKDLVDIRLSTQEKRLTQDGKIKMVEVKSALELEKKESEIALLDEQKKEQRILLIGIVVLAVLLVAFMVVLQRSKSRIEQQKAELAALNATKDKLFAILSHDLMSPVATLKNYMSLIDWGIMSQEQFAQSSERLKIKVNNLYNLLENVLHWSITQMKGIKPKIETVNIETVINEQIALLETVAESKTIHITQAIPSDATIQVDKNHLALIVRNLFQNALKFTDTYGQIGFSYQNTEGGKKIIRLEDTGIGMSQDTLDKLFKTEQNTHRDGTAKEGGTGLGLILAKELVQLNGGTIDVASEVNKGTRFTLSFPS